MAQLSNYGRGWQPFLARAKYLRPWEPNSLSHENAGEVQKVQSLSMSFTAATKLGLVDHVAEQLFRNQRLAYELLEI